MMFSDYYKDNKDNIRQPIIDYTHSLFDYNDEIVNNIIDYLDIAMANYGYLDLLYDDKQTNTMLIGIFSRHIGTMIYKVKTYQKTIVNGLNEKEMGTNKTNMGYAGYDLDNQDGSYQNMINTANVEKYKPQDIYRVVDKYKLDLYKDLINDILDELLVIIY